MGNVTRQGPELLVPRRRAFGEAQRWLSGFGEARGGWRALLLCGLLTWSCGGSSSSVEEPADQVALSQPTGNSGELKPRTRSLGSLLVGQELYLRKCAGCHGSLSGQGQRLVELARTNSGAVSAVIREGRGTMPSYGNRLPEALVDDVVAYLRTGGTLEPAGP